MNNSRAYIFAVIVFYYLSFPVLCQVYDNADGALLPTSNNFAYPQSIFVDSNNGNIWVTDFDNNRVLRFDVSTLLFTDRRNNELSPQSFFLSQNYPNPFNDQTNITFSTKTSGKAVLSVYNVLGQEIITLFNGNTKANEIYSVLFNTKNLPSGIYFYFLSTENGIGVKQMCVLR